VIRLTGSDAMFLYAETPTAPMHTLKISIFPESRPLTLEEIKQQLLAVIHRAPSMRWRILPVPFALHHPVAVDDPDFDIDFHVRHVALPRPGGMREFEDMVGQICSHPLDRHRPLWEMWVVEGLEGPRIAFVFKVHHAIADGMASVNLFTRLLTAEANEEPPAWSPPPLPRGRQLLWRALLSHARRDAKRFPQFLRTVTDRYRKRTEYRKSQTVLAVDTMARDIPHSRFNYALTTQRKFATATHSLAVFKTLGKRLGGTLNDVVLAVLAGALRRYLLDKGDSVDLPLIAIVPVSADEPGSERLYGNNFSHLGSRLYVQIADPIERFRKTQESTNAGKSELEIVGRTTMPMLLNYLPPFLTIWAKRREYKKQLARRDDYVILGGNVAISNVPGPRSRLSTGEIELETLYSVGPVLEGTGLNITVWSYVDQLNFSIIGCKKLVPDPRNIALFMRREVEELRQAADLSTDD